MNRTHKGGFVVIPSAFDFIRSQVEAYNQQLQTKQQQRERLFRQALSVTTAVILTLVSVSPAKVIDAEELIVEPTPTEVFDSSIEFDKSSPTLLVIDEPVIEIKPGKSLATLEAEARTRRLAARNQFTIAIHRSPVKQALSAEEAHRMAQEAAAKAGIPEQWKILVAIWQKETGKSGDSCIVSKADGRATGPMQFMPGTFSSYKPHPGANICKAEDALVAAGNLLKRGGVANGNVDGAIHNYNHSMAYVRSVKSIANSIQ